MKNTESVKQWRKRTKQRIIEAMGGKCCCCKYNNCESALELHHINRKTKKFTFAGLRASPKAWSTIVSELRKCVLVCANCHREIEEGIKNLPINVTVFNEKYVTYTLPSSIVTKYCDECNVMFDTNISNKKYCTEKCKRKACYKRNIHR